MELHTFVGSPNSRKAEAVIDHLGLDVRVVHHDFAGGGLRRPEYLALNPSGMVPTLVDGAFILWESNAIMQYLADKAGDDALLPRDPQKRADVLRWQCWELAHFNRAFGTLAFETVAKPALNFGPADASLVAAAQAGLERFAPVLERHLAGREQMVGDGVTIADYSMHHVRRVPEGRAVRLDALSEYQPLLRPHAPERVVDTHRPCQPCISGAHGRSCLNRRNDRT